MVKSIERYERPTVQDHAPASRAVYRLPNRTLREYAHSPLTPGQVRRLIPLSRRQRKEKDGDKSPDPPHSGRTAPFGCIRDSAFGIHRSRLDKCAASFPSHGGRRKEQDRRVFVPIRFRRNAPEAEKMGGTPATQQLNEQQPNSFHKSAHENSTGITTVLARTWQIGTTTKQRILNPTVSHFKVVAIRSFLCSLARQPFGFRSFPSGSLRLRLWSFPPICHRKPSYASQCFISSQCVCFIHISSPIFTPVIHPVSAKAAQNLK